MIDKVIGVGKLNVGRDGVRSSISEARSHR